MVLLIFVEIPTESSLFLQSDVFYSDDELRVEVESLRSQLERTLREAAESIQLNTVRERDLSQRVHDLMNEVRIYNLYLDLYTFSYQIN